jgi:hypothetical protein
MPHSEMISLLWAFLMSKQIAIAVALLAIALILSALLQRLTRKRPYAERQLALVRAATFEKKRLLNKTEYNAYKLLRPCVPPAHLIAFQVSLGELLRHSDQDTYRAINSKRADFAVIDTSGFPVAIIEVQGAGHNRGDAALRDEIKRLAVQSAGIAFIEIFPADDPDAVAQKLNVLFRGGVRLATVGRAMIAFTKVGEPFGPALRASHRLGRAIWRRWSGYHRRSRVETKMRCFKALGERIVSRDFERQVAELHIRVAVLNRFTALGIPVTQRVA